MFNSFKEKTDNEMKASRQACQLKSMSLDNKVQFHEFRDPMKKQRSTDSKNFKIVEVTPKKPKKTNFHTTVTTERNRLPCVSFSNMIENQADIHLEKFVSDIDQNQSKYNLLSRELQNQFKSREEYLSEKVTIGEEEKRGKKKQFLRESEEKLNRECMICGLETKPESSIQLACIHRIHKSCSSYLSWKEVFKCNICQRKGFRMKK